MDHKEEIVRRNRRTLFLLLAGGAGLFFPLAWLLYSRMTQAPDSQAEDNGPRSFARRESPADRIKAAPTPAPPMAPEAITPAAAVGTPAAQAQSSAPVNDSLGFVKGGADYDLPDKPKPAETPAEAAPPPQQLAAKDEAPPKKKQKSGLRPFVQPRLQNSKFSSNFSTNKKPAPAAPAAPGAAPDMSGLLQNVPGAGDAGAPDMSSLLQNLSGSAGPAGGGTVGVATSAPPKPTGKKR